tara:strand:- start:3017 stop:5503 length:2487 start_codon:yes stop_codon:yes gene_type:complete
VIKLNKKIFLILISLTFVYSQDLFLGNIEVVGSETIDKQRIINNSGLYQKEVFEDINLNNKYDFEEPFIDYNNNGYFDYQGTYIRTGDEIKNAISNLWNLNVFSDIKIFVLSNYDNNIDIQISIKELPYINEIQFIGNKKIKDKKLINDIISIKPNNRLTENEIFQTIDLIKQEYIKKDYHKIDITYNLVDVNDNRKNIIFNLDEGSKMKINEIIFRGNDSFTKKELINNAFMNLKEVKWLILKQKYIGQDELKNEIDNLYDFYNNRGFRDFRLLNHEVVYSDNGIDIVFVIDEGKKNYFKSFHFSGNLMFDDLELMDALNLKEGDEFNKQNFDLSIFNLNSKYYDAGYYFLSNEYKIKPFGDDLIDVFFDIQENDKTLVRKIFITGNSKTNDNVIRRELKIYPGDIFSMKKLRDSYGEAIRLNFFSAVDPQISIVNNLEDKVDLNFNVIEKETGSANFSMGYSEAYGLTGGGGFSFSNFRGRGQLLSIEYTRGINQQQQSSFSSGFSNQNNNASNDYESYSFSFREPSINNSPNSLGVSFSHTERGRQNNNYLKYDIKSDRISLSVGRKFNLYDYLVRTGWTLSFREIKYIGDSEDLLNDFSSDIISLNGEESFATRKGISITQSITRDTRDYPDFPRKGSKISWSSTYTGDFLGGNENYQRNVFDFNWFTSIEKNSNFVLYQDLVLGITEEFDDNEYLPYNAKFRMGGDGIPNGEMLRGYNQNSIYGYESAGGKIMFKYSSELRYLVSSSPISYFFVFGEAGNVWNDFDDFDVFNLKRALGIGFRIYMPMLGILGYDYGYGFDSINEYSDEPAGWQGHIIFGVPIN